MGILELLEVAGALRKDIDKCLVENECELRDRSELSV